jgi:hypothetical protein
MERIRSVKITVKYRQKKSIDVSICIRRFSGGDGIIYN